MHYITKDVVYVGVNDHAVDLFEGQYVVPNGMSYNSYVVLDEKVCVFDTVDQHFTHEWLDNVGSALNGRKPDYLIVQHMEPDHSANIDNFVKTYPDVTVVGNAKTFAMMEQFFGCAYENRLVVKDGDTLTTGRHTFTFVFAPMVHWPEVMVTYDSADKILFSADGFGKFGALDVEEEWACEARRYYIGIVGKYGAQVQALLKKAAGLDIAIICPLHGPILTENLGEYIRPVRSVVVLHAGERRHRHRLHLGLRPHEKRPWRRWPTSCAKRAARRSSVHDLARCDMAEAVEDAFRYNKLVLATTTYNAGIFPFMREFIDHLTERNFQKRTVALIENGTWAPLAAKVMKDMLAPCKGLEFVEPVVKIRSALDAQSREQLEKVAGELCQDYMARSEKTANKKDMTALFRIGYGLYVVTSNDGKKDNGLIVNTVSQVTDSPNRVAVTINKANYSHHVIKQTGVMNVNCLSVDAPFKVFETFGFQSGRTVDKFASLRGRAAALGQRP